jgi:hypothetical protein
MHIFWADLRTFRNFSGSGGTGQRGGQGLKTRRWGLAAGRRRRHFRPGAGGGRPEARVIEVFHMRQQAVGKVRQFFNTLRADRQLL